MNIRAFFIRPVCAALVLTLCRAVPPSSAAPPTGLPAVTNYLVTFDRAQYAVAPGAMFPVQVLISPVPPPGVFSFGVKILAATHAARVAGVGAVTNIPELSFNGPLGPAPVIGVGPGYGASKGTVAFFRQPPAPSANALLATFYLSDQGGAAPYDLALDFFNTLGPTEQIFVDGAGHPLDAYVQFSGARVVRPAPQFLELTNLGPIALNRQSGLFEQTVRVTSRFAGTVPAFHLLVRGVPTNWTVWNATGLTNGLPYLAPNISLLPNQFADVRVQYRIVNRVVNAQPLYEAVVVGTVPAPTAPTGVLIANDERGFLPDGSFLLEFATLTNRSYSVQWSADMSQWTPHVPALLGTGSRVQWIDYGPPRTPAKPGRDARRFYRVFLLP